MGIKLNSNADEEDFNLDDEEASKEQEIAEQQRVVLESIGMTLAKTRLEFIRGRRESGIEDIWREDEEHYNSIDYATGGEMTPWGSKPLGRAGVDTEETDQNTTGSTVFINITAPYCDMCSARISDMLMPVGEVGWSIEPSAIPDMALIAGDDIPASIQQQISHAYQGNAEAIAEAEAAVKAQARQVLAQAREAAEKATKRIKDWHIEHQYYREVRKALEGCSRVGAGILKGPYPKKKRSIAFSAEQMALVVSEEVTPASKCINHWNFYPDPGCGEDIQNGAGVFERDEISEKVLRNLIGTPGYFEEQINACLEEGPLRAEVTNTEEVTVIGRYGLQSAEKRGQYEIWYYHGSLKRDELESAGMEDLPEDATFVDVQITMVNNRVIRAILNPLDTGEFPYDVMPWKEVPGYPWGIGVSRQVRTAQIIINAAARNMMDNAGRASGPQVLFQDGVVEPEDGIYEIVPWKFWRAGPDADLDHLDNAFRFVTVNMFQPEMQAIIDWALKMAEEVTGLPVIMQGQTNVNTPETLGGMQLQHNNSSTVLRRIARLYDDKLTVPSIKRYYAYLLQYGTDDAEKGDFTVEAKGSSTMVEREIQNQQIGQLAAIVRDPVFGLDPKKWIREYFASQRLNVENFQYDDEEWQQIVEQMAQPPQDSSVMVAEIRAQNALQVTEMRGMIEQMKEQMRLQLEQGRMGFQANENERDRQLKLLIEQMTEEVDAMRMGSAKGITDTKIAADLRKHLEKIKADLAKSAAQLNVQRELSYMQERAKQVAPTKAEPIGRAESGEAFSG